MPMFEGDPAGLRRVAGVAEQGLGPGQPAAADRAVAEDHQVHAGQRPGRADRADMVAGPPMGGVRALPFFEAAGEVELQVGGLGQALEHGARRGIRIGALEEASRGRRVAHAQRGATLGKDVVDRDGHGRDRPTS